MSPSDQSMVRQLGELCSAFLRLPGMLDHETREMYVELLQDELGTSVSFSRHRDPRHDVYSLLYACLDHTDAIRTLAGIVREFYRGTLAMQHLDTLVEVIFPEDFLDTRERNDLVALLVDIDPEQLLSAFRFASPPAWSTETIDHDNPRQMLRRLESVIGSPNLPAPVLVFVDFLAHQLDGHRSAELHRWLDEIGPRKNVSLDRLRQLCVPAQARLDAGGKYYFVVKLQPDAVDSDRYLISVWLQRHGAIEVPLHLSDAALPTDQIIDLLSELLESAYSTAGVKGGSAMTIEFILPRRLINEAVHEWRFDKDFPLAFGTRYPVVIRSLDRMGRPRLHDEWQRKWRWLKANGHRVEPDSIKWLSERDAVQSKVLYNMLLQHESTVAMAMSFLPEPSDGRKFDEFAAALYAGIPIIIFARQEDMGERFELVLRDVLATRGLGELPAILLKLRREPDEELAFGSNVTLMWDDYDRIPESFTRSTRLQAPQRQ